MTTTPFHVVCAQCTAVNRVPASRLGDGPRCAQCKQPLFAGQPLTLTDATFERWLQHSDLPLLVDFWAEWCGPCRSMAPAFAEAAARLEPRVILAKVDVDASPRAATQWRIQSIPTLCLFRGGRELARQSGAMTRSGIERWVDTALDRP